MRGLKSFCLTVGTVSAGIALWYVSVSWTVQAAITVMAVIVTVACLLTLERGR